MKVCSCAPLGGRMGGEMEGDCNQNMAPFFASGPLPVLPHAGFEDLAGVEVGVLAGPHVLAS
jgi:hypothetical protein